VSVPLRICVLARSLPLHRAGGFELHTAALIAELAAAGHAVTAITSRLPAGLRADEEAAAATLAPRGAVSLAACRRGIPGRYDLGYWPESRRIFARIAAREPFDLLVGAGWGAAGVLAARREPSAGRRAPDAFPAAMIAHGSPRAELRAKRRRLGAGPAYALHWARWRLGAARLARAASRCDRIVAVSASVAERMAEEFPGCAGRIVVVPNGVDLAGAPRAACAGLPSPEAEAASRPLRIAASGRLHADKGIEQLLRAAAELRPRYPRLEVAIAGEGPRGPALQALAGRLLPQGAVRFHGHLPRPLLLERLAGADLYVFPSTGDEGLPLALLEAMGLGLPVVASRVSGVTDALRDGREGLLVPPGDARALAGAMAALLEEPDRARSLGRAARERCLAEFSAARMLADLRGALEALARAGTAPGTEAAPD